jgi:hypothetical protein
LIFDYIDIQKVISGENVTPDIFDSEPDWKMDTDLVEMLTLMQKDDDKLTRPKME